MQKMINKLNIWNLLNSIPKVQFQNQQISELIHNKVKKIQYLNHQPLKIKTQLSFVFLLKDKALIIVSILYYNISKKITWDKLRTYNLER